MALRHPPALHVLIVIPPGLRALLAALAGAAMAAPLAALASHAMFSAWLLALIPAAVWLAWRHSDRDPQSLQWDGQCWRLAPAPAHEPGRAVEIEVLIDLGDWLLLRARAHEGLLARRRYLPLSRKAHGASWGALRATLYSAHPTPPSA